MTYATLMVHLEAEHTNDARLQIAGDLAERMDAKVIGITASDPQLPYYPLGTLVEVVDREKADLKHKMDELESRFRSVVGKRARAVEWRCAMEAPTQFVVQQSRAADLLITGTYRGDAPLDPLRRLNPSDLIMQAGRPVLVVPPEVDHLPLKRVLIAWKDTREARRAIADALPLLHHAEEIDVLEVVTGAENREQAHTRVNDVVGWLEGHGISAVGRVAHAVDQRDEIDHIWQSNFDLVIAGAYGHARFREWAFGGFTRTLLMNSRRCAMITH